MTLMSNEDSRWVLPNLEAAIKWCKNRNRKGICCTIDVLGENIASEEKATDAVKEYLECAQSLHLAGVDGALAVKSSSIGAKFNKTLAQKNILKIFQETEQYNINIELDMEGTPLVGFMIETALGCADRGYHVTLALQAYLNRTENDLKTMLDNDITVRLVKGAYLGDTNDFQEIQNKFKYLANLLLDSGKHFTIGTHDPELIEWVKSQAEAQKDLIEFGFLMGLADKTKLELIKDGWAVCEYVPFDVDSKAYVARRLRYLRELAKLRREPVP